MDELLKSVATTLEDGEPVALSTVIRRRGSLPMSRRARMLVRQDGSTQGTVGGGCLEAEVYATARQVLETGYPVVRTYHLTEIEEGIHGHVCGGTVTILTEALLPQGPTTALYGRLQELVEGGRAAALATRLPSSDGLPADPSCGLRRGGERWLVDDNGATGGDGFVDEGRLTEECRRVLAAGEPSLVRTGSVGVTDGSGDDGGFFVDPIFPLPRVTILGAGHCGRAIGKLADSCGFSVTMLDDRPAFADPEVLPWAASVRVVDFKRPLGRVQFDDRQYLVIVTRGHEHDLTILRQLIDKRCAYLGMIGSERKKHLFFKRLRAEGFTDDQLQRLRSPMGLPIAADTPQEIAVAVVGEMIAVRRGVEIERPAATGRSSRKRARTVGRASA